MRKLFNLIFLTCAFSLSASWEVIESRGGVSLFANTSSFSHYDGRYKVEIRDETWPEGVVVTLIYKSNKGTEFSIDWGKLLYFSEYDTSANPIITYKFDVKEVTSLVHSFPNQRFYPWYLSFNNTKTYLNQDITDEFIQKMLTNRKLVLKLKVEDEDLSLDLYLRNFIELIEKHADKIYLW